MGNANHLEIEDCTRKRERPCVRLIIAFHGRPDAGFGLESTLRLAVGASRFYQHARLDVLLLASDVARVSNGVRC